ncbi:hypothetical protein [Bradyrhizobium sp. 930_D9_N1_4]|uniref:hypothetical protein n=1 Tax=Bradyrhizobium sp. 930_D9_N1_4 TaxID=3240374 RepID=UPI003F8B3AD1
MNQIAPSRLLARFDPRLADELERIEAAARPIEAKARRSPDAFNYYARSLTPNGGVRIIYRDLLRHWCVTTLRFATWCSAIAAASFLLWKAGVGVVPWLLGSGFAGGLVGAFVFREIFQFHKIEIHPDGIIVDGRYFSVDLIGENWPTLQFVANGDQSRYVLTGIYGTRLIEYATCNRVDRLDRTPELLAQDLDLAMEQLWGRREAIFAAS